ncbi:MAG: hypothetical protein IOD12_02345 [Silvanigrellales bacterium]|nr:hypothetical protein [Silvanigrellales bacterium]
MGKKKAKKRLQHGNGIPPHAGVNQPPGGDTVTPSPDFSGFERLLPKLILFPSEGRKTTSNDRRALERCVRLCEALLALRPEAERAEQLGAFLGGRTASPQLDSLLTLIQEAAGPQEKMSPSERGLHDRRVNLCKEFEGGIPRDLQEWMALWDRRIDEKVGEDYLQWLSQGGLLLQRQTREWVNATTANRPGRFGLFERVRSLKWASRARKDARTVLRLRRECESRRKRLEVSQARVANLCGVLAAFLKAPAHNAGANTRVVRKLLVLELERELGMRLQSEIKERDLRLARNREALRARAQTLVNQRAYVDELEARKNLRLVDLYAASCANVKEALPAATVQQVNAAFAEVDAVAFEWNLRVDEQKARVHKLKRELERLLGVVDEYAKNYFGTELRQAPIGPFEGTAGAAESPRGPIVRPARLDKR